MATPTRLDGFIQEALYAPEMGYYNRPHAAVFGRTEEAGGKVVHGDFVTAPKLTNLFGKTLLVWVLQQWQAAGSPSHWQLLEVGPGDGTLMADLLAAWPKQNGANPVPMPRVFLCEAAVQNHPALHAKIPEATVLESIADVPPAPFTVLIGNELLDAFPLRQQRREEGGEIEEAFVHTEKAEIIWQPTEENCLEAGATFREWSPARNAWLEAVKGHFEKLAMCLLDYGAAKTATESTLQGIYQGQKANPLAQKGQTDITHQVNFAEVAHILGEKHCQLTEQAAFLLQNGLTQLALAEKVSAEAEKSRDAALFRLLHPTQMGHLFKVLTYKKGHKAISENDGAWRVLPVTPGWRKGKRGLFFVTALF